MKEKIIIIICALFLGSCAKDDLTQQKELITETKHNNIITETLQPTKLPTSTSTLAITPSLTISPTPIPQLPFDLSSISFPLAAIDILFFRANYDCETTYGDYTHDGFDIPVVLNKRVPVHAVADGILYPNWINNSVGYEIRHDVGEDINGDRLSFYYIHLDEIVEGLKMVKQGEIIGYLNGMDHLHFELRCGSQPRFDSPSDGMQGDELDITEFLLNLVREIGIPEDKIIIGCDSPQ